jgi:hypothetical protein
MYRVFALIIILVAVLSIGSIFQSGVTVQVDVPTEVIAGTEFEVRLNIQKGDLESFSRLQQALPAGLTAVSSQSSNADFTFEEKRVRLIWLRLPRQDEFSVVYKIKVDERLKGTFDIKGKFSYIEQNERKSVSMESAPIVILPSPNIDPALIVDINDFEEQVIPYIPVGSAGGQIACIRQTPISEADGSAYIVNILVNKESKQKFAKIEEEIPPGYTAIDIDPQEAIFTFKGGMVKFLWMNLPADPYFTVSYKLIPQDPSASTPQMEGKFSYLEGEKTISIDIKQTDSDLASLSATEISGLIAALSVQEIAEATATIESKPDAAETKQVATVKTTPSSGSKINESKSNLSYQLEPEDGVYYRIQLAAGHKSVNIEKYFKKYNLEKEVRKEFHEGWHKYSVGSFQVYRDARDYRVHIWNTTIIDDAFVSAYNNGQRITVQEALMIANQQWYK